MAAREAAEAAEKRQKVVRDGTGSEAAETVVRRPAPLRLPGALGRLPWDLAQDEIGVQTADWLGLMAKVVVAVVKDEIMQKAL